jgi:hypothetical protein
MAPALLNPGQHRETDSQEGDEDMKIRTQLKAGKRVNHNEALRVRTAVKAGKLGVNHNEALRVRTSVKAGKLATNHNGTLQVRTRLQGGKLRKQIVTTSPKEDRLTLLVVRAGLRAGRLRGRR